MIITNKLTKPGEVASVGLLGKTVVVTLMNGEEIYFLRVASAKGDRELPADRKVLLSEVVKNDDAV